MPAEAFDELSSHGFRVNEGVSDEPDEAHDFMRGKSRAVMKRLSDEMSAAAEDMEFEIAARLREGSVHHLR